MGLVTVFLITTGFVQPNIEDHAHILDKETRTLVTEKNNRYFQTKEQPQIVVITVKRLNKLTPKMLDHSKRTVFIVVGQKGKKRNVQIYSTKDLHSAFTEVARGNILRAEVDNCVVKIMQLLTREFASSFGHVRLELINNINMHLINMI